MRAKNGTVRGRLRWGAIFFAALWATGLPAAQAPSSGAPPNTQDNSWMNAPPTSTGIAVGQRIPAFRLLDQDGKPQTFDSIKGPKGAVIYFNRSVDWCPYCKTQVVELQRYVDQFRAQGLGVAVITYDTVAITADFSKRQHITLPILADPQSKAIRDFGVLNTSVPAGHLWFGVPYPGTFVVDANGIVKSKYFEDRYQDRYSAPTILLREFGSVAGTRETTVDSNYLSLKYFSTTDTVRPALRFTLVGDFTLPPRMHVYTPDVKGGYIPVQWRIDDSPDYTAKPPEFPKGELLMLPAINEIVSVYQNSFRVTQDVVMAAPNVLQPILNGDKTVKISGELKYQACDDKICYLPQTVPLVWTLKVEPLDRERVPEPIRHQAPSANP